MRWWFIVILLVLLSGCEEVKQDKCLRTQIFQQCLEVIKPQAQYIPVDLGEAIKQCDNAAFYQCQRLETQIKPECR